MNAAKTGRVWARTPAEWAKQRRFSAKARRFSPILIGAQDMANGAGGRPPEPAALRALKGKPVPDDVPDPTPGAPQPPEWLSAEALAEWGRLVPELDRLGLLAKVDRAALVVYCESWAAYVASAQALEEHGPLVPGREGSVVKNPAAQMMRDSAQTMLQYGARFGFTPSDRMKLSVPKGKGEPEPGEGAALYLLS